MFHRAQWLLATALLFVTLTPGMLQARDGDQVHIGQSIIVGENQNAGSVVCIGCSIRMDGNSGDVVAIGGSIAVNGNVKGSVVAVGGGALLGENSSVSEDVVTVGGHLARHPNAVVKGDVSVQSGAPILIAVILVPLLPVFLIVALVVWLVRRNRRPVPAHVGQRA